MPEPRRCAWVPAGDELYSAYHDREWGVPSRGDRHLFEMLVLEGAQAGLSWRTILGKREAYRRAFAGFDPEAVARFDRRRIDRLVADPGIVRHRGKIEAAVGNARVALAIRAEHGTLGTYLWSFVGGKPRVHAWRTPAEVPARTAESDVMSRELGRRGMKFVGSKICYAFMQATGMVCDHTLDCAWHPRRRARRRGRA